VSIANNGLEAFQKRKDGNFDLIFMDIQMPFLDGVEATAEILQYEEDYNQPHVPILALTANALKGDRERFLEAGLDEYTTKPLVRSEIISLLNHFLSDYIVEEDGEVPKSASEVVAQEVLEPIKEEQAYKCDILLAKKSPFESKLYVNILESLGYSYEVANTTEELEDLTSANPYKLVLVDKELENLDLEKLSGIVKSHTLESSLVLIRDLADESVDDKKYVQESIRNVINKDLLRLVFEKFV
jgi:CheY-like chemotaxis protein